MTHSVGPSCELNDGSAGALQAGAWVKVADASVGAAQKPVADGGVGGAGPEGSGVVIDMTTGVLGF